MFGLRGSGRATVNPVVALPHLYLQHYLVFEARRFLQTVRLKRKWEGDSQSGSRTPTSVFTALFGCWSLKISTDYFGWRASGRATVNPVVALPHLYLQHYLVFEATRFLQTVRLKSKWEGDRQSCSRTPTSVFTAEFGWWSIKISTECSV